MHLRKRQEETARAEAKIRQLIQTLDLRKDEAIERTFKARPLPVHACAVRSRQAPSASQLQHRSLQHLHMEAMVRKSAGPRLWELLRHCVRLASAC